MLAEDDRLWGLYGVTASISRAYKLLFSKEQPGSATVLADLAKFCFALAPTSTEREQGRREVWLHIQERLRLTEDELFAIVAQLRPEQRTTLFDRSAELVTAPRKG